MLDEVHSALPSMSVNAINKINAMLSCSLMKTLISSRVRTAYLGQEWASSRIIQIGTTFIGHHIPCRASLRKSINGCRAAGIFPVCRETYPGVHTSGCLLSLSSCHEDGRVTDSRYPNDRFELVILQSYKAEDLSIPSYMGEKG